MTALRLSSRQAAARDGRCHLEDHVPARPEALVTSPPCAPSRGKRQRWRQLVRNSRLMQSLARCRCWKPHRRSFAAGLAVALACLLECLIVPPLYVASALRADGPPGFWMMAGAVLAAAIRGAVCAAAVTRAALGRHNPTVLALTATAAGLSLVVASQLVVEFSFCMVDWAAPLTRWGALISPSPTADHYEVMMWNHFHPLGGWALGKSGVGIVLAAVCPLVLLPMVSTRVTRARQTAQRGLGLLGLSALWLIAFDLGHAELWRFTDAGVAAHAAGEWVGRGKHTAIEVGLVFAVALAALYAIALSELLRRFAGHEDA